MSRSRIQDELEALKKRGIAQTRKESLKDAKTFRTPEEERALLKKLFLQKYKRNFANMPKPTSSSSTSEWDAWHLQQRKLALLEKKKKQEAEKLLRMYRGSVSTRNVKDTEIEKKLSKTASESNILQSADVPSGEGADLEQTDDLSSIADDADEDLNAFIASMADMKEEEVQAMLASAEEEELSVDSSSTPPGKNADEIVTIDSKGDVEVESKENPPQPVEAKENSVEEKKEEPPVIEKEEEPTAFQEFSFRDVISKDVNSHFPAEKGRYELYLSPACPRSHEVQVVLALKGLTDVITTVTAEPILQPLSSDEETEFFGWVFPANDNTNGDGDAKNKFKNILELYQAADDTSDGKYILPVLWDTTHRTIVNNNFYDILRILNSEFNDYATFPEVDLYPEHLKKEIASFHTWMYDSFTNGVYKCAVATTQESYIDAVMKYTEAYDKMESILSESSYLIENTFTIVDVCLFCSLFRLDEVYNPRFYINTRSVMSSESMKVFCRLIYSMDNVKETCDIDTIKKYYFGNAIVPERKIIPLGPNFLGCLL